MSSLHDCDQGKIQRGGLTSYAHKIFDIASNGISQSFHLKMQGLFGVKDQDKRYHRINIELTQDIPLDDTREEIISDLRSLGREAIEENHEALQEICKRIK